MKQFALITFLAMLFVLLDTFAPVYEGKIFPVVDRMTITKQEPVGETQTRIWGTFNKLRDCDFKAISFWLGNEEIASLASLIFEEKSKTRTAGLEDFGPWLVQLDEYQLANNSFSTVTHECHPFWNTKTRFYP